MNISTHLEKDVCPAPRQASFEFEDDIAAAEPDKAPDWEPLEDFRLVTEEDRPPELNAGGRYDEATGKTWFEDGDREAWAKTEDLQGIGVLPDGTMVGNVGTDVYALPVFEIVSRDALGNILYGYLGKACGFSDRELYLGASINQIKTSGFAYFGQGAGGDDPRDRERIREGIDLYYGLHS